jgi:hypothetical protein
MKRNGLFPEFIFYPAERLQQKKKKQKKISHFKLVDKTMTIFFFNLFQFTFLCFICKAKNSQLVIVKKINVDRQPTILPVMQPKTHT